MDSFEQYKFTLKCSGKLSSSQYLQIKANIETVCKFASQQSKQYNLNNVAIALQTDPHLFMTIYIKNNEIAFGIYEADKKKIYLSAEDTYFKNISMIYYDRFKVRIENHIKSLAKGIPLCVGNLLQAWEQKIKELQQQPTIPDPEECK